MSIVEINNSSMSTHVKGCLSEDLINSDSASDSEQPNTPISEIEVCHSTPQSIRSEPSNDDEPSVNSDHSSEQIDSDDEDNIPLCVSRDRRANAGNLFVYEEMSDESDVEETPRTKARSGLTTPIVELILGKKSLTMEEWDKQYGIKNTQFIQNGSRLTWDCDNEGYVEKYLVKWKDISYIHSSWEELSSLEKLEGSKIFKKIQKFNNSKKDYYISKNGEELCFNDKYIEIERILDAKIQQKNEEIEEEEEEEEEKPFEPLTEEKYKEIVENNDLENYNIIFYIKWDSLPYKDSTWERIQDLIEPDYEITKYFERKELYKNINKKQVKNPFTYRPTTDSFKPDNFINEYKNGNELRDYQIQGIKWLVWNWINRRNSILADEMGLGKTIQTIGYINYLYNEYKIEGPFIVIAPLSTIPNWKKEIEEWSNLYAVVYHGDLISKKIIQNYEWKIEENDNDKAEEKYKFDILITTPEIAMQDANLLSKNIKWSLMVIDEAHKIKNINSKLRTTLVQYICDGILLLTGTPIQNEISELYSLLNFIDRETFRDYDDFAKDFGDIKDSEKINELHDILRKYFLRRMKGDVETNIKPKQELLIEVELTSIQKKYYRAIYEKNIQILYNNENKSKVPSMMNIMMELRKCCNHPYLISEVEDKLLKENNIKESDSNYYEKSMELLINTSGKMVLLEKLLPKLQSQKHRILIFSQMVRVLDILQDYLTYKNYSFERLDGTINGTERQNAIDRFTKENSDIFIFLICTKAGGLGINLTAADTVIVFDSDWNPQNDIQAIARCHRIGQTNEVKVYRFITRKTYEYEMFSRANMKLGLDKAILHNLEEGKSKELLLNKKEIENLLKYGAYHIFEEEKEGISDKESQIFCDSNIDQILEKSCKIITSEDNSNGKDNDSIFSKASFVSNNSDEVDINDPDFWSKYVGINNNNNILNNDNDDEYVDIDEFNSKSKRNKLYSSLDIYPEDESDTPWTKNERDKIISALMTYGFGKWEEIKLQSGCRRRSIEDISNLCVCIIGQYCRAIAAYKNHSTNTGVYTYIKNGCGRGDRAKKEACNAIKLLRNTYPVLEYISPDIKPVVEYERYYSDYEPINHPNTVPIILRDEVIWKKYFNVGEKHMFIINQLHLTRVVADKYYYNKNSKSVPFYTPVPMRGWSNRDDKSLIIGISKHGWSNVDKILADNDLPFNCGNEKEAFPKFPVLAKRIKKIVDYEMNHNSQMRINNIMPSSDELLSSFGLKNNSIGNSLITKQWNDNEIKKLIFIIESIGLPTSHFKLTPQDEENEVIINYELTKCIEQALIQAKSNNNSFSTSELMDKYSIDTYPYGGYEYIRTISKIYTKDSIMIYKKIKELESEAENIKNNRRVVKQYINFTIHTAERFLENIDSLKILRENILKSDREEIKQWLYNINEAHVKQIAELPIKWESNHHDYVLLNKIDHYGFKNFNMILRLNEFSDVCDSLTENSINRRGKFLIKLLKKVQPWKSKNTSITSCLEEDNEDNGEEGSNKNIFEKFNEEEEEKNSQNISSSLRISNPSTMDVGIKRKRKIEDDWNPDINESSNLSDEDDDDEVDNIIEKSSRHSSRSGRGNGGKRGSYTVTRDPNISREEAHEMASEMLAVTHIPITVKGIKVLSLGKIDYKRSKYHNEKYLWPIGYKSVKLFTSYKRPEVRVEYTCEILDGGDNGPLFRVKPEDDPSHNSTHVSPTSAWNEILNLVKNAKVAAGQKKSGTAISGPDYFGYTQEPVCYLIEGLENAEKCDKYIFRYQRINERKGGAAKKRKTEGLKENKNEMNNENKEEEEEEDDDDDNVILTIRPKRKHNNNEENEKNKKMKIEIDNSEKEKGYSTFIAEEKDIKIDMKDVKEDDESAKDVYNKNNEEMKNDKKVESSNNNCESHFIDDPPKEKKISKTSPKSSKKSKKNSNNNVMPNQGSILSFFK